MDRDALKAAYQIFFNHKIVPPAGLKFDNLTPGDFAQVRKQAEVLGAMDDIDRLVALLKEVSTTKPGASEQIGFMN